MRFGEAEDTSQALEPPPSAASPQADQEGAMEGAASPDAAGGAAFGRCKAQTGGCAMAACAVSGSLSGSGASTLPHC